MQVFRISDILVQIRFRLRILLFSSVIFNFFVYNFLKVHLHHSSKIKKKSYARQIIVNLVPVGRPVSLITTPAHETNYEIEYIVEYKYQYIQSIRQPSFLFEEFHPIVRGFFYTYDINLPVQLF
jgi:hypothetical protein